jgi:hypothetical protein
MSFEEKEAANFENLLDKFYNEYNTLLVELVSVIANYREVIAKINERQPLIKRKEPQQPVNRNYPLLYSKILKNRHYTYWIRLKMLSE